VVRSVKPELPDLPAHGSPSDCSLRPVAAHYQHNGEVRVRGNQPWKRLRAEFEGLQRAPVGAQRRREVRSCSRSIYPKALFLVGRQRADGPTGSLPYDQGGEGSRPAEDQDAGATRVRPSPRSRPFSRGSESVAVTWKIVAVTARGRLRAPYVRGKQAGQDCDREAIGSSLSATPAARGATPRAPHLRRRLQGAPPDSPR